MTIPWKDAFLIIQFEMTMLLRGINQAGCCRVHRAMRPNDNGAGNGAENGAGMSVTPKRVRRADMSHVYVREKDILSTRKSPSLASQPVLSGRQSSLLDRTRRRQTRAASLAWRAGQPLILAP